MQFFFKDQPIDFVDYCIKYKLQTGIYPHLTCLDSADMLQEYFIQSLSLYIEKKKGFIYIANHTILKEKNVYKVGFTKKIASRQKSLNNASVIGEIIICNYYECLSAGLTESYIKEKLKPYQMQEEKEYFKINYSLLESVIKESISYINSLLTF